MSLSFEDKRRNTHIIDAPSEVAHLSRTADGADHHCILHVLDASCNENSLSARIRLS